jgi:hypothetical protein
VSEQEKPEPAALPLIAYEVAGRSCEIRPAPFERDWMDATGERFAYRCLPLNIANAHGWELLCPSGFTAGWTGGTSLDSILIGADQGTVAPAVSHFGYGVLTFHVNFLFRTPPGFDLMAQGPINRPKDGISALSGVIETDWAPFTFTMNWIFTRPGSLLRFETGEPFCHIFPIKRGELESMTPEVRKIATDAELKVQHEQWAASRHTFNKELEQPGSAARAERWQKNYYKGLDAAGRPSTIEDHRTRVRLKNFER